MPSLPSLQYLELYGGHLADLPATLISELTQLTHLSLRMNEFTKIPKALAQLTGLVTLDMSLNAPLQLEKYLIKVIGAMPKLESFHVFKSLRMMSQVFTQEEKKSALSQDSISVLLAVKAQYPRLILPELDL